MNDFVEEIARRVDQPVNLIWVLGIILLVLIAGSAIRLTRLYGMNVTAEERKNRLGSLVTWWVLLFLLAGSILLGREVALVLFACISFLGLREFRILARERIIAMHVWWRLVYLAVPIHYLIIYFGEFSILLHFTPAWALFILSVRLVVTGHTHGFLETAGITFLGLMLIVFLFSHTVLLLSLNGEVNPAAGPFGLFLFVVLLTEVNDIAQALWGRQFGKHKITPQVSPNKTWEGFLLGITTTAILACVLAPFLTPFADRPFHFGETKVLIPFLPALVAGLLIGIGGFFGDITMSAVKRDAGVKDSGTLLPGQGGILDRMDSLTFSAPLFFYYTYILYG